MKHYQVASQRWLDAAYCYGRSSMVCLSVCISVATVNAAKAAEPIVMPFGMFTRMGPRNHVLDGSPDTNTRRANFEGENGLVQDKDVRYTQRDSAGARTRTVRCGMPIGLLLTGMHIGAAWRIRLNRPCAAAMRSYVTLL